MSRVVNMGYEAPDIDWWERVRVNQGGPPRILMPWEDLMKSGSATGGRKPPTETVEHDVILQWMNRAMPDLQPVLKHIDGLIHEEHPVIMHAFKWKKAYYGSPETGWLIELVAYDVSVNVVFLGGSEFDSPPPLGETGRSRYIKLRSVEEADSQEMRDWIREAAAVEGWC